jgi:polysaccharide pyruvyl transferase WcaK-like protein
LRVTRHPPDRNNSLKPSRPGSAPKTSKPPDVSSCASVTRRPLQHHLRHLARADCFIAPCGEFSRLQHHPIEPIR